jgi:hypothetical protein
MEELVVPAIIVLTSAAILLLRRAPAPRAFYQAVTQFFEFCGTFLLFLTLNTFCLVVIAIAARALSLPFISLYMTGDPMLFIFSGIQALIFWLWWRPK